MAVQFIIDSASDILPEEAKQLGIAAHLPLKVLFGEEEYADAVSLSHDEFYNKLAASEALPTTSQVSPAAFEAAYEQVVAAGDTAVVVTMSGKLSGTYQSAVIAASDFEGKVFVVDSQNIAISLAILAEYAVRLADEGKSAAAIAEELTAVREKVRLFAVVDTLEYLQRGGRVSKAVAIAGGMLAIKPLIGIVDGKVAMIGKARGNKAANRLMNQEIEKLGIDLTKPMLLGYTGVDDSLLGKYMTECEGFWPEGTPASIVSGVVGTHAGPGAVACAFFAK